MAENAADTHDQRWDPATDYNLQQTFSGIPDALRRVWLAVMGGLALSAIRKNVQIL